LKAIADVWAEKSEQPPQKTEVGRCRDLVTKSDKEPGFLPVHPRGDSSAVRRAADAKIRQQPTLLSIFHLSAIGHAASCRT